jgi:cytochrome P450
MQAALPSLGPLPASFPPGPRGVVEVTRAFRAFTKDHAAHILHLNGVYGGASGFRFAGELLVFLSDPELIHEVLLDKEGVFIKDRITRGLSLFLGQGLLTSEGELWRRQRKLIAPSLSKKHIAGYADSMVRLAGLYADGLVTGETRDVAADMTHVTLEIVVETLFGAALSGGHEKVGRAIDSVMDDFQEIIQSWRRAFPAWFPFAARRRTAKTMKEVDAIVLDVVRERRKSGVLGDDLLSRLLVARDEADPERGMSDQQLRDEVMTLFMAGHETTANALAWTLMLLAEHPEIDHRLDDELSRVLDGRPATADDLASLPLADAIVKESMRLYPPAHTIGREATRDLRLGPFELPAHTSILISPWAMHHDPRFFPDPEAFHPDRWLDGSTAKLPKNAYMPFGGGPRVCVGNHFAIMEAVLVLVTIAQRARFERLSRDSIGVQPAITLRPLGGLPLRVRRRASSTAT